MKLQNLNQAQLAAVQAPMGATMVLAGAGTGKTRVLTNRILYIVEECGVHPSEILAITFTNKAANEMKKRLYEFECHAEYMHISTIHSFCAFVLRREAERIGRSRSFSIYDEEEKKSVLKKLVRESCDDSSSGIVDKIADGISNIKNNAPEAMVSLAQNADVCVQSELDSMSKATELGEGGVIKSIEEYNARLKGNNAVDFDDLLYFVHTLFKKLSGGACGVPRKVQARADRRISGHQQGTVRNFPYACRRRRHLRGGGRRSIHIQLEGRRRLQSDEVFQGLP